MREKDIFWKRWLLGSVAGFWLFLKELGLRGRYSSSRVLLLFHTIIIIIIIIKQNKINNNNRRR
jgi:hypothetical protein